jgi:hypothetical protein
MPCSIADSKLSIFFCVSFNCLSNCGCYKEIENPEYTDIETFTRHADMKVLNEYIQKMDVPKNIEPSHKFIMR